MIFVFIFIFIFIFPDPRTAFSPPLRLTLEQRFFTDRQVLRLARVGGAVFFDVGRAWFAGGPPRAGSGVLEDVGVGPRLASTRSGPVHLDAAFPLDGDGEIESVQWLVRTHDTF